jgi:hypothetical protein
LVVFAHGKVLTGKVCSEGITVKNDLRQLLNQGGNELQWVLVSSLEISSGNSLKPVLQDICSTYTEAEFMDIQFR